MLALASDFDRTLFFHDQDNFYYRKEDIEARKQFQTAGNLFGVCTGRSYSGIVNCNFHQIAYDFYIVCSGAKILDRHGHIIYQKFIDKSLAKKIYDHFDHVDTSIVYQDKMYIMNRLEKLPERLIPISSFDQVGDEFEAFSMHFSNSAEAKIHYQMIIDEFGDVIDVYQNERHLDFATKGCSKGNGIAWLINYFNLLKENMAVIGDSWNDITMLQSVDNSFTFNRSPEEVKEIANYLVDGIDECIAKLGK